MNHTTIPITKGAHALVSPEDAELVSTWPWYLQSGGYAARTQRYGPGAKKKRVIYMHRLIMDAPDGFEVDHINGDRLDNRRENLRLATKSQQRRNAAKRSNSTRTYKGAVYNPHKGAKPWTARATKHGVHSYGAYFATELEAAHEYDRLARALFGDRARLNFPEEPT